MTSDSAISANSLRAATAEVELRVLPLSPAMIALERAVENVAATRLPVLILGEAGSGKRNWLGESTPLPEAVWKSCGRSSA